MAHIREPCNGRITIMFCGFEGPARIMRFFGHGTLSPGPLRRSLTFIGRAIEFGTPEYDRFLPSDVRHPGSRCAVVIDIHKVSTVRIAYQVLQSLSSNFFVSHVGTASLFTNLSPTGQPCTTGALVWKPPNASTPLEATLPTLRQSRVSRRKGSRLTGSRRTCIASMASLR